MLKRLGQVSWHLFELRKDGEFVGGRGENYGVRAAERSVDAAFLDHVNTEMHRNSGDGMSG